MDRKAVEGIKDGALMELDDGVSACCVKRQCYIRFSRGARVMYKANLSWSKLQDSFKKLEAKNLIYIETDESTRRRRIRLTESGVIFVARHKSH
jgi:hypothetical protein